MMEVHFLDRAAETLPRAELEALQLARLRATLAQALRAPAYRGHSGLVALGPDAIGSLDDVRRLPFTTKDDLRAAAPFGHLAAAMRDVVRIHSTSGTTGTAVAIMHTREDLDHWAVLVARALRAAGLGPEDVFQNMAGYGLFTGGLGFHYGAEKLGMATLPTSAGNSRRQLALMQTFGTTATHLMPTFALHLIGVCAELGIDPRRDTRLKAMLLGAEPHSEATRDRLEGFFGCHVYNSYGLTEMNGPGLSFECQAKDGLHFSEDHFLVELVDPEGDEPVAEGEVGELVYTTLTRSAVPILRYRSRDLAAFASEPCACGRTLRRVPRILGRRDDLVIYKGVNIYPIQVETVLAGFAELHHDFLIVLEGEPGHERMAVEVSTADPALAATGGAGEALRRRLGAALRSEILVGVDVVVRHEAGERADPAMKPRRVDDRRRG